MHIFTLYNISKTYIGPLECKAQIWSRKAGKHIRVVEKVVVFYNITTISSTGQYKEIREEWGFIEQTSLYRLV
jgi:hypothetical protein